MGNRCLKGRSYACKTRIEILARINLNIIIVKIIFCNRSKGVRARGNELTEPVVARWAKKKVIEIHPHPRERRRYYKDASQNLFFIAIALISASRFLKSRVSIVLYSISAEQVCSTAVHYVSKSFCQFTSIYIYIRNENEIMISGFVARLTDTILTNKHYID